jgi:hypothetical protein
MSPERVIRSNFSLASIVDNDSQNCFASISSYHIRRNNYRTKRDCLPKVQSMSKVGGCNILQSIPA